MHTFTVHPLSDQALTIVFGREINPEVNHDVMRLRQILTSAKIPGIVEFIPTYCSLTVCYDPLQISGHRLKKEIIRLSQTTTAEEESDARTFLIPVCYGGAYGEDMELVKAHTGLSEEEIIRRHSGTDYLIYMLGFLPGFSYLGGLDASLHTPRLPHPRTAIPQGAVGIGGSQTGIYPLESPGGWNLIGRTPVHPYDAEHETILYKAGDYIRFIPITEEEYKEIEKQVKAGTYICTVERRNAHEH